MGEGERNFLAGRRLVARVGSHCLFVQPLVFFTPDFLRSSVAPLFLQRSNPTGGAGGLGGQRLAVCDFRAGRSRGTADWDTSSAYEGTASSGRRCHLDAPHYILYGETLYNEI